MTDNFPWSGSAFGEWLTGIRRTIHRYPELAFEEQRTAEFIADSLDELRIPFRSGIAETGIVAFVGSSPGTGPCIALRADMDALPVEEKTGLSFASEHPGRMHACGHDGHVAMLLGAAAILSRTDVPGTAVLVFQPAEEECGGAEQMVQNGALNGVQAVFGGHIDRHYRVGEIAVQPGLICAYTDTFHISIRGRGGHAARPHETADSIVVASLLVMSIQTLVSREINPAYPSVVSVGVINGGSAHNVIAEQALLKGTIRATHPDVRQQIISGLERMVKAMAELYKVETSIEILEGYPPVINDRAAAEIAREAAGLTVGAEGIASQPHPSLGGEDFSFYLRHVPGCFVRFGARKADSPNVPAHSPFFDFDERVLPIGAAFMARVATSAMEAIRDQKWIPSNGKT
ncbi:MAG TPA: amidohydrolase [Thermodesulfobacteriaceae bacterium]|nr:amidohydrolase [Thermodesulfobacteriaceae bacterium]